MSLTYDLHSHSTASDGGLAPRDVVIRACRQNVDVLALTDHDTTSGIDAAIDEASRRHIILIPGVEISVTWNGQTLHILGLHVDISAPELALGLARLRKFRHWRAEEIGKRLHKQGIPGAFEGAKAFAHESVISRTHFGQFLVKQGLARDMRAVFKKYLVQGKPGYVPGQWAELEDAISWINAAGGQAVIAHPCRYRLSWTRLRRLFAEFRELGGRGIEVVSSSHQPEEVQLLADYADHHGLYASAGSDFHFPDHSWAELGKIPALPAKCTPIWKSEQWRVRKANAGDLWLESAE